MLLYHEKVEFSMIFLLYKENFNLKTKNFLIVNYQYCRRKTKNKVNSLLKYIIIKISNYIQLE